MERMRANDNITWGMSQSIISHRSLGMPGVSGSYSFNTTGAGLGFGKNTCYLNLCNSNSSHAIPSTKG